MKCDKHPEKDALAVCVECGKGICDECRLNLGGKNYCQECADNLVSGKTDERISKKSGTNVKSDDGLDVGEGLVVCLFSPLAGLIGWLVWHNDKPKKAQQACIIAIILFVVWLFIYMAYVASLSSRYYY